MEDLTALCFTIAQNNLCIICLLLENRQSNTVQLFMVVLLKLNCEYLCPGSTL